MMEDSKDGDVVWGTERWRWKHGDGVQFIMYVRDGYFWESDIPFWDIKAKMKLKKIK